MGLTDTDGCGATEAPGLGRLFLARVGSLWFSAVLLMALLVAMACATVYEATYSSEHALAMYYCTWWFETLLWFVGINVIAAVFARWPLSRSQLGFAVTHLGIVVILVGALVTIRLGVHGYLGLDEGDTSDVFTADYEALTVTRVSDDETASRDLLASVYQGFVPSDNPSGGVVQLGDLTVQIRRYLPDSLMTSRIANDGFVDRSAIEVSVSKTGIGSPVWVFDDHVKEVGRLSVAHDYVDDSNELATLISEERDDSAAVGDHLRFELNGKVYEVSRRESMAKAIPIGDTGYTAKTLQYLAHAMVSDGGNKLVNAPDRRINPAVRVEIVGPSGKETRLAFSKFPEFQSMHGGSDANALKMTFVEKASTVEPDFEVLVGSDEKCYVRFHSSDGQLEVKEATLGEPLASPWVDQKITVLRRFDKAHVVREVEPVMPVRETRQPAILVDMTLGDDTEQLWLQKQSPRTLAVGEEQYRFRYGSKELDLGFSVKLDRFQIRTYPGGGRPRSFESQITIVDPETGGEQAGVISMNNPLEHRGFTLFQSSYQIGGGRRASILSVSRDPGQTIVFVGYVVVTLGMIVTFTKRVRSSREEAEAAAGGPFNNGESS